MKYNEPVPRDRAEIGAVIRMQSYGGIYPNGSVGLFIVNAVVFLKEKSMEFELKPKRKNPVSFKKMYVADYKPETEEQEIAAAILKKGIHDTMHVLRNTLESLDDNVLGDLEKIEGLGRGDLINTYLSYRHNIAGHIIRHHKKTIQTHAEKHVKPEKRKQYIDENGQLFVDEVEGIFFKEK